MRTSRSSPTRFGGIRLLALVCGTGLGVVSCGSRTGLWSDGSGVGTTTNGPDGLNEAGVDGGFEAGFDSGQDAPPLIDVMPRPDADRTDCPDADATFIYVVTEANELFSFYPPDLTFKFIGNLACPAGGETPFSMAVDRRGVAYVVYTGGALFRVSTATAACVATPFAPNQHGFTTFGMGFASDVGGAAERLYVSGGNGGQTGLGFIDTTSFTLSFIGAYPVSIPRSELTGTGDGRLFAYWPEPQMGVRGSHLTEVNKATAAVVAQTNLPIGGSGDAFAFAFWGGDFWIFTSPGAGTDVNRFRPTDGTTTTPTTHPSVIVGAGVSTCAPQL